MPYVLVALLASVFCSGGVSAQALVRVGEAEAEGLVESCLAPDTIDEWRESGTRTGAQVAPMLAGEELCNVLKGHGVFLSVVVHKDGPPDVEPFGLCYPAGDNDTELECAMFRGEDGDWRVSRIQRLPR